MIIHFMLCVIDDISTSMNPVTKKTYKTIYWTTVSVTKSKIVGDKAIIVLNGRHLGFSEYTCWKKLETGGFESHVI